MVQSVSKIASGVPEKIIVELGALSLIILESLIVNRIRGQE